jgi:hypothetical protein
MASTSLRPDYEGTTIRGGSQHGDDDSKMIPQHIDKSRAARTAANDIAVTATAQLPFVDSEEYLDKKRPFCVRISESRGGVVGALQQLDTELRQAGHPSIFSGKNPVNWTGRNVSPGEIGLYLHGAAPKILLKSGRYPGFPFGWWWAREYVGTYKRTFSQTLFKLHI